MAKLSALKGELPSGIGIDDGAAVLFEGLEVIEVVTSRPATKAYQVKLEKDGQMTEEPLRARYL